MDFTLKTYRSLLEDLKTKNYTFLRVGEYLSNSINNQQSHPEPASAEQRRSIEGSTIILLRHDVDRRPANALAMAKLESGLGIKSTYYFRIVPESFNEEIIEKIAEMGHEIGYHYEEIDLVVKNKRQEVRRELIKSKYQLPDSILDSAWEMFKFNLERLRKVADIKTICAHGSPLSPFSNHHIWDKYHYKDLKILGDANLDTDWNEFSYLTDTGRRWDGESVSVRDKAPETALPQNGMKLRSTTHIMKLVHFNQFPQKAMINTHPERWNDNLFWWSEELVSQNMKNLIKKWFFVKR